ncbi:MAG: 50S ribosomal protein L33 [Parcubacteria group bacterium]|nr:50S ribosomal protein L33 [Parcubacteria group bacterium]
MSQERLIQLKCGDCKRINYYIGRSKGKDPKSAEKKLELKKFCQWCRKHTVHKESKIRGK